MALEPKLTLTVVQLEEIIERAAVRGAEKALHQCRFQFEDQEVRQIEHVVGMVKDLGNGSIDRGAEVIRKHHDWVGKRMKLSDLVGSKFILTIVGSLTVAVIGGIGLLILSYTTEWVKKIGGN